jgi:thymidylate synthase (FAD)
VTANLREWRNILKLRCSTAAHPQIRELMIPLLKAFKMMIPVVFDDIYEQVIGVSES